ncbi:sporulation YhaL family protein [Bacillus taeanensis]|nr:sporulation YhaL family protein [Bacillus taeanensis]
MRGMMLVLGAFIIYIAVRFSEWLGAVGEFAASLPWWIYFVLAGIIFSGYKVILETVEEKKVDQQFIEQEGNIYIRRMEDEKKRRTSSSNKQ